MCIDAQASKEDREHLSAEVRLPSGPPESEPIH